MCCELQLKSYVVPAGHCNAQLRPSIACQLSALGRQRLMGSVLVFACSGDGPERIIPCRLVPHLKVRCMTSAMSPCVCLAMASRNTSAMPCLHLLNTLATMLHNVIGTAATLLVFHMLNRAVCTANKLHACMQDFYLGKDDQQAAVRYEVAAARMISAADAVIVDPVLCSTPMAGLCRCSSTPTNTGSGT